MAFLSLNLVSSVLEGGVLDIVPSIFALHNGVDPYVEFKEVGSVVFDLLAGTSVGVEILSFSEESRTVSFVGVVKNTILVGVALG